MSRAASAWAGSLGLCTPRSGPCSVACSVDWTEGWVRKGDVRDAARGTIESTDASARTPNRVRGRCYLTYDNRETRDTRARPT